MERGMGDSRPWWRRKRVLIPAALVALLIAAVALSDPPKPPADGAAARGTAPARTDAVRAKPAATVDPVKRARSRAARLARRGEYATAAAVYAAIGLHRDATRVRRAGARRLVGAARAALAGGRYATARRLATRSRRLHPTAAARSLTQSATAAIAAAAAAERLARDRRTCSSAEKATVRADAGAPPGCAGYAARRAAKAQAAAAATPSCDPNYKGACLKPDSPDYDCEGGSGNGPDYTGPVEVVGDDHYGLDADGDGYACES